jgi:hypothetical protein
LKEREGAPSTVEEIQGLDLASIARREIDWKNTSLNSIWQKSRDFRQTHVCNLISEFAKLSFYKQQGKLLLLFKRQMIFKKIVQTF